MPSFIQNETIVKSLFSRSLGIKTQLFDIIKIIPLQWWTFAEFKEMIYLEYVCIFIRAIVWIRTSIELEYLFLF